MAKSFIADKATQNQILAGVNTILGLLSADDEMAKSRVAANYFALQRTGAEYGVYWPLYSTSNLSAGTRTRNAANLVAYPSTDTVAARNDFDQIGIFKPLECTGHVNSTGEFVVEYFAGEDGYDPTTQDKYCLFGTHYFKYDFSNGEELVLTDQAKNGFMPEAAAIRKDGTVRSFVAIAAYFASNDADGVPTSTTGKVPIYSMSHNTAITKARSKGSQYCMTTMQDIAHIRNLFMVAFATRNSQDVMKGCTSYNFQYNASLEESGVERVVVTSAQAENFIVGSRVSIGEQGTNTSKDRAQAYNHNIARSVEITAIEAVTDSLTAIYVDNGGETFDTTTKTLISTMPWATGATDLVLGSCGSPGDNDSGMYPCKIFGVEMFLGMSEVVSNVVMLCENGEMYPYIVYDCTLASASAPSSDYAKVDVSLANTKGKWEYASVMGYDPANPSARFATEVSATSTTGYGDATYTINIETSGRAIREVLFGGSLTGGAGAGLWYAYLTSAPASAPWAYAARLSASGSCAASAA